MRNIVFILCTAAIALPLNSCNSAKRMSKVSGDIEIPGNTGMQEPISVQVNIDQNLTEKYWKLIELYGSPITSASSAKEAHIIFHTEGSRFSGNAGCNNFTGNYQTQDNARIVFSQTAVTNMMCLDMDTETKFMQVLETADSYSIRGDTMTLNRARMAPLARFVVVYL
jgi:heat shock protein HslJ